MLIMVDTAKNDFIGLSTVTFLSSGLFAIFNSILFLLGYLLFFTRFWWIAVLICTWSYIDFNTSKTGGRRRPAFRKYATKLTAHARDYLGVKLIKTVDLDPTRNYIIGFHPHGSTMGLLCNILSDSTGFSDLFPGITPYVCVLNLFFAMPFVREFALALGAIHPGKESFNYVLSGGKGRAVVILVGGSYEVFEMHPGKMQMSTLKKRKGFVKMALTNGAYLVPLLSFGDNDIFDQLPNEPGSTLRNIQEAAYRRTGCSLPYCPVGRYGILPYRKPIHSVVGKPIPVEKNLDPTIEEIDALHAKYVESLIQLFEDYKPKFPGGENLKLEL